MDEAVLDVGEARALGRDVATYSHEDLPGDRLDALSTFTEEIAGTVTEDPVAAADALLAFWAGHVSVETGSELAGRDDRTDLFAAAHEEGALGVDLYQALAKTTAAARSESGSPDLEGWTNRLFELTNRHVAHLHSH